MKVEASMSITGLGWIAINEFAMISNLPYCLGVKGYREKKTFFRSFASGTFVFDIPEYYYDEFCRIYDSDDFFGSESLPKRIPAEGDFRLQKLLDDVAYVEELKKEWLAASRVVSYTDRSEIYTKYGRFPYKLLHERIFSKIGWLERFFLNLSTISLLKSSLITSLKMLKMISSESSHRL